MQQLVCIVEVVVLQIPISVLADVNGEQPEHRHTQDRDDEGRTCSKASSCWVVDEGHDSERMYGRELLAIRYMIIDRRGLRMDGGRRPSYPVPRSPVNAIGFQ